MKTTKIITVSIAILFTAQACNFLFGDVGGGGGSGPKGVFISFDSGSTWAESNLSGPEAPLQSGSVSQVFLEVGNPKNLLVSTSNAGIFASDSGGESWVRLLPDVISSSAFINPQNNQEIYAGGANRSSQATIWKSSDRGSLWVEIFTESSGKASVSSLTFDPLNPSTFYASLSSGTILKSSDSGSTWSVLETVKDRPLKLVVATDGSRSIYLLTTKGLMRSRDGGINWEELSFESKPSKFNDLFVESRNPLSVYVGTDLGLFRSRDGGNSFEKIELPANQDSVSVSAVAVNPDNSSQIFASIRWTIYRSDDAGLTWKTVSLPTRRVVGDIVVDTFEPNKVYAGVK